jgi:hypothetical protein
MSLRTAVGWFLLLAVSLGAWTGCAHYQLGTGAKPSFASLYVEPVENQTLLPQARAILTTRIRDAFVRDDRVSLANSPEAADATLQVIVRDYRREVASVQERDTGLARKFTLSLRVTCTLVDRRTGKPLFTNRELRVERDAFTDGGQLQAEYQTLPLLAEALGQRVAATVLDVW